MNPLPKSAGWLATIIAVIAGFGYVLNLPVVHDLVASNPTATAILGILTVVVSALSHSLPGDGGDGSKPNN